MRWVSNSSNEACGPNDRGLPCFMKGRPHATGDHRCQIVGSESRSTTGLTPLFRRKLFYSAQAKSEQVLCAPAGQQSCDPPQQVSPRE